MTVPAPSVDPADLTRHAADTYPRFEDSIPTLDVHAGRYRLRFARCREDLDAVLRLRFEVFNLELGEGLDDSFVTGRDEDDLDESFHHLMIVRADSDAVVGTYRMQTGEMAQATGFYSAGEFLMDDLPSTIRADAVEIGRACVARDHRNGRVLHLLWRGLAAYLSWNHKRYLFGCCSLPTLDPGVAQAAYTQLRARGCMHETLTLRALPEVRCSVSAEQLGTDAPELPPLFESYLRLGARVCGAPAIDRRFKTIDFFVVLDIAELDGKTYRTFFQDQRPS